MSLLLSTDVLGNAWMERPASDGRTIFVLPLTYDRARVGIGTGTYFLDDLW